MREVRQIAISFEPPRAVSGRLVRSLGHQSLVLPVEQRSRRAVGSMDLRVTVVTGPSHDLVAVRSTGQSMAKSVTIRAKPGPRHFQHELIDRAVGFMTVQAVHANRLVFEQERSALFGMTLVASVVDRSCPQQVFIRGAVRLMAIGAGYL